MVRWFSYHPKSLTSLIDLLAIAQHRFESDNIVALIPPLFGIELTACFSGDRPRAACELVTSRMAL
jgi:hypothetical protein